MKLRDIMAELETLGTAQNRKVYARHGYGENMFGVSFANLRKLTKRIGIDQALAGELWRIRNEDARMLACMVADPSQFSARELDGWLGDADHPTLVDVFTGSVVAKSPHARRKAAKWIRSKRDLTAQAGWLLVTKLARDARAIPDTEFEAHLDTIETTIHSAGNRTKHAMNMALIAIGIRSATLRNPALAAAGRIGKVEVDHGETGCKTPDAATYIQRAVARKAGRVSRRASSVRQPD